MGFTVWDTFLSCSLGVVPWELFLRSCSFEGITLVVAYGRSPCQTWPTAAPTLATATMILGGQLEGELGVNLGLIWD